MIAQFFEHKSYLHTVLRLNAAFSGLFGLIFIIFPGAMAEFTGIPSTLAITITGIFLIGWEIFILYLVTRNPIPNIATWLVIEGDVLWVLGTIALLLSGWLPLTTAGKWFLAIIGDIVLLFAILQFIGLRRQKKAA